MLITLAEYYAKLGLPPNKWHIGPEHPHLENYALKLLKQLSRAYVLEIGYQAGGFAIPVILEMKDYRNFNYVGIDNGAYPNSVEPLILDNYLKSYQVMGKYTFYWGDAKEILKGLKHQKFDLILLDHAKQFYAREFYTLISKDMLSLDGYILLHDVLEKAEPAWKECEWICRSFNFTWQIVEDIPGGLAVVKRNLGTLIDSRFYQLSFRCKVECIRFLRSFKEKLIKGLELLHYYYRKDKVDYICGI